LKELKKQIDEQEKIYESKQDEYNKLKSESENLKLRITKEVESREENEKFAKSEIETLKANHDSIIEEYIKKIEESQKSRKVS